MAIGIAVTVLAAVSSCDLHEQKINSTALQQEIADRLEDAGQKPESVHCSEDLRGEVGHSVRCEVVLTPTNSIEPIVRVTKVDGAKVTYEVTPALSRMQLQRQVGDVLGARTGVAVHSVSCESGIEGVVGNQKHCSVRGRDGQYGAVVTVTDVDGLSMGVSVTRE